MACRGELSVTAQDLSAAVRTAVVTASVSTLLSFTYRRALAALRRAAWERISVDK